MIFLADLPNPVDGWCPSCLEHKKSFDGFGLREGLEIVTTGIFKVLVCMDCGTVVESELIMDLEKLDNAVESVRWSLR